MKVVIDCDDAAVNLKKVIVAHLEKKGIEVTDLLILEHTILKSDTTSLSRSRTAHSKEESLSAVPASVWQ